MQVTVKGRIVQLFDGTMTDKRTGEVQKFSPSVTLLDEVSYESYKVQLSEEQFRAVSDKLGVVVSILGVLKRPPQPAVLTGIHVDLEKKKAG